MFRLIFNFYNAAQTEDCQEILTEDRREILRVIEIFLDIELYFSTGARLQSLQSAARGRQFT